MVVSAIVGEDLKIYNGIWATNVYVNTGNLFSSVIVGDSWKYMPLSIHLLSSPKRLNAYLFCHLRAKMRHERNIFVMESECRQ